MKYISSVLFLAFLVQLVPANSYANSSCRSHYKFENIDGNWELKNITSQNCQNFRSQNSCQIPASNNTNVNSVSTNQQTEQTGTSAPVAPNLAPSVSSIDTSNVGCSAPTEEFKAAMLAEINRTRSLTQTCGTETYQPAGQVTWNNRLTQASLTHSIDMSENDFFSHYGSTGKTAGDRSTEAGYNWRHVGENIAAGQRNLQQAHIELVNSPGHCRNLMKPVYTHVGAACTESPDSKYKTYWTITFGTSL